MKIRRQSFSIRLSREKCTAVLYFSFLLLTVLNIDNDIKCNQYGQIYCNSNEFSIIINQVAAGTAQYSSTQHFQFIYFLLFPGFLSASELGMFGCDVPSWTRMQTPSGRGTPLRLHRQVPRTLETGGCYFSFLSPLTQT